MAYSHTYHTILQPNTLHINHIQCFVHIIYTHKMIAPNSQAGIRYTKARHNIIYTAYDMLCYVCVFVCFVVNYLMYVIWYVSFYYVFVFVYLFTLRSVTSGSNFLWSCPYSGGGFHPLSLRSISFMLLFCSLCCV